MGADTHNSGILVNSRQVDSISKYSEYFASCSNHTYYNVMQWPEMSLTVD